MATVAEIREWFRHAKPQPADTAMVQEWCQTLAATDGLSPAAWAGNDDAERVDLLTALEALKSAAAAAQARISVAFEASQRAEQQRSGVVPDKVGCGVAEQVALARGESPTRGSRHLGLAKALVHELPHTHQALTDGLITEWGATLVAKATACLAPADRMAVDAALSPRFGELGEHRLGKAAQALAYQVDPEAWMSRGRRAAKDRRVTVRPAPDVMALVTGYLPAAQGVACFKALDDHARAIKAAGDERTLDQIKADTFVQRLTGQAAADRHSVEVQLVMTDSALFGDDDTAAHLHGYGPIPAADARDLVTAAALADDADGELAGWIRRLFADPVTGQLTGMDHTRRRFGAALRRFIKARDQVCSTPFCEAPIRHIDHARRHADGGPSDEVNGQGLCERCNYAKEAPGWSHAPEIGRGGRSSTVTTPTGRAYRAHPPPVLDGLGHRQRPRRGTDGLDDTG